jgi:ankyrin repeat protein
MIPKPLLAIAALIVAIVSAWWFENRDYVDPVRNRRHCAAPPDAIQDWSYNGRARKPSDAANLDEWLQDHGDQVNRQFGAFCLTPLHSAARFGREDLAQLLIAKGADVHAGDEPAGNTPLHLAAQYGHVAVAKVLVAAGADVNAGNTRDRTPMHDAVSGLGGTSDLDGRLAVARLLISRGANINARERGSGRTPIDEAAASSIDRANSERMTELLLASGASAETADPQRASALQQAVAQGSVATVRSLLDHGADPNSADRDSTSLATAAYMGQIDVVTLLLDRGADASRTVSGSRLEGDGAPLSMAFTPMKGIRDRDAKSLRIATLLLDRGAAIDARDRQGRTVLHGVAERGQLAAAELLLSRRAAVDLADASGMTPLHLAVKEGHAAVASLLLEKGADARARAKDGTTVAQRAAGDREMEALVQRYAKR